MVILNQLDLKNELKYKGDFCMCRDIHGSYRFIEPFQGDVIRLAWAQVKWVEAMSHLYLKNELTYKVDFSACG